MASSAHIHAGETGEDPQAPMSLAKHEAAHLQRAAAEGLVGSKIQDISENWLIQWQDFVQVI